MKFHLLSAAVTAFCLSLGSLAINVPVNPNPFIHQTVFTVPNNGIICGMFPRGLSTPVFALQFQLTAENFVATSNPNSRQPKRYNHYPADPVTFGGRCTGTGRGGQDQLYEYPIYANADFQAGMAARANRIIVRRNLRQGENQNDATFCGLITHNGVPGNAFRDC
ncbi:predicted protein [Uncinocarpus reesii 1704]|uniref:Uncharacterized protein n=1 Tax=Uncinocarpus reesii (strain UAMH 1704) TaxID=336963 RepID=C4JPS5_UNCRE|nr:uncharacterized protein UREG_04568 [Uncinocarpus reesii 1704]EEP79722.1 predicted protein [Uncinocarpus reesii 1704]